MALENLKTANLIPAKINPLISSQMRRFADDSCLFTRVEGVEETQEKLAKDLQTVPNWAYISGKCFLIPI